MTCRSGLHRPAALLFVAITMVACPSSDAGNDDDSGDDDDTGDDDDSASVTCPGDYSSTNIGDCTIIEGSVFLYGQPDLTNVDGLSALTAIGGALQLYGNNALADISGLASLTSVAGGSNIYANPLLCQTDVEALSAGCPSCGVVSYSNDEGC